MAADLQQLLEDYAQGVGPGALAQQGSTLPVTGPMPAAPSALGPAPAPPVSPQVAPGGTFPGLPLSPPSPGPNPAPQAPLLRFGGQQVPLESMIQQQLQALQNYSQMGPLQKFMGGNAAYGQALTQLPLLEKLASTKSQERQLQQGYLKEIAKQVDDFSKLTPEEQTKQGPLQKKLLAAHAQLAGLQVSDEDLAHPFSSPDLAQQYAEVLNDTLIPHEQALAQLSAVKAGPDRLNAIGAIQAQAQQKALTLVQQYLPQAIAQYGGAPDKPISAADLVKNLQADPQLGQYLKGSPSLNRALNGFLSDKANAETLAGWGVKPGTVNLKEMEQQAKGPELTGEVKDVLATMKGPDGKPLLPNQATPQQIAGAKQQVFKNKLDISSAQGFNAVLAKTDAERKIPIIQVPGMADVHIVNKKTEMPIDRLQSTIDDLKTQGGEDKFAVMNNKSYEAFAAAKEADGILAQYLDISKVLTTTPGANFTQALIMYAKTKGGVENPGVQFDALKGTILRMARAMQGSSQSLSNLDANSVAGMLPSTTDTAQTALQRLEVAAKIVQNMKDTQLGKMQPEQLLDKISAAKADIAKMQGVDIYQNDKGQQIVLPRGSSHPGKGWTKQGVNQ